MKIEKRKLAIISFLLCLLCIGIASACSYFHVLPINGIGYWTKHKEDSKVIVMNVSEHITCNNGMLHLDFKLKNTDGKVNDVEVWIYFKDGASNGGNVLIEKYIYVGVMNANETKDFSMDILFTPASLLDQLSHEDFSIHYNR
jgi:hypothetical protein